ncbi:MAG: hypothetical protein Q8P29_00035 [Candidatus Levybacteria bacterium]|nr:hypothetical protein [Candidatus Levybacteria bacterium]MDZ4227871.1 hypothetical protein [Candidatus Levybacteria bacterium]
MNKKDQQGSSDSNKSSVNQSDNVSFLKMLAIGFAVVSLFMSIAVVAFLLTSK